MLGLNNEDESNNNILAVYGRVLSHEQKKKGDLDRQVGYIFGVALFATCICNMLLLVRDGMHDAVRYGVQCL